LACAGAGGDASATGFFGGVSFCGAPAGAVEAVPAGGNGGSTLCDSRNDPSGGNGGRSGSGSTLWDSVSPRPPLAHGFQTQQAAFAENGATASIETAMETVKSNRVFMDLLLSAPLFAIRNTAWRQGSGRYFIRCAGRRRPNENAVTLTRSEEWASAHRHSTTADPKSVVSGRPSTKGSSSPVSILLTIFTSVITLPGANERVATEPYGPVSTRRPSRLLKMTLPGLLDRTRQPRAMSP